MWKAGRVMIVGPVAYTGNVYVNLITSIVEFFRFSKDVAQEYLDVKSEERVDAIIKKDLRLDLVVVPPLDLMPAPLTDEIDIMWALSPWRYYTSSTGGFLECEATWEDDQGKRVVMHGVMSTDGARTSSAAGVEIVFTTARPYCTYYNGSLKIQKLDTFNVMIKRGVTFEVTFSNASFTGDYGKYIVQPVMQGNVIYLHAGKKHKITRTENAEMRVMETVDFVVTHSSEYEYKFSATINTVDGHRSAAFYADKYLDAQSAFSGSWVLHKLCDVISTIVGLRYAAERMNKNEIAMSSIITGDPSTGFKFGHDYFKLNLTTLITNAAATDEMADVERIYTLQNCIALYFILSMCIAGKVPRECMTGVFTSEPADKVRLNVIHLGSCYLPDANRIYDIIVRASYNYYAVLDPRAFKYFIVDYATLCYNLLGSLN
jgi:hypothetical protein